MPRLVKRYSNRKLYDTSDSRYVTLDEIARWVKAGEEVKIVENDSGEDLTAVTFAQIILEEERKKTGLLSLRVLRDLIQHGEQAWQGITATVDRGMEAIRTAPERAGRRVQELTQVSDRLAQLQSRFDPAARDAPHRAHRARARGQDRTTPRRRERPAAADVAAQPRAALARAHRRCVVARRRCSWSC